VCFGEVIEQRVEMTDASAKRLVEASDESGPEGDDGAGACGGAAGARDKHGGAMTGVCRASDIWDATSALAGGSERDIGAALP